MDAVTNGRLDSGAWQRIFHGGFHERRRKRVLVKIIGERAKPLTTQGRHGILALEFRHRTTESRTTLSQYPILQTKLYIPPIRSGLVPRPRLIERLNAGLQRKLTLVSAPAGFGKTTLVSEWVTGCSQLEPEVRAAWLTLDEGDNDPVRFLAYMIAALRTLALGPAEGIEANPISGIQATQGIWMVAALLMLIPIVMLVLTLTLKYPAIRWVSIVAAVALFGLNLIGLPGYPGAYDKFLIVVGLVLNVLTVWYAWKWV